MAIDGLLVGGAGGLAVDRGLIYIAAVSESAAEHRARRVLALARAGRSVTGLLDTLGDFENGWGCGAFRSYESNVLDTALAIQALSIEEEARQLAIVPLLDALQIHQNPDGGWGYLPDEASEVYFSAEAALALASLTRLAVSPEPLSSARDFLLSKQLPDGSFGSPLETALAYRALLVLGVDTSTLAASPVDVLVAAQAADGSWESDAFVTGQVLLALGGELANLSVPELSVEPATILPGEAVTVTATVRNIGPVPAPISQLAIRVAGVTGELRGEATIPELLPGAAHEAQVVVATAGDSEELVLFAVADDPGAVAETDEGDNARSALVSLRTEPDLAVYASDLSIDPVQPDPGFEARLFVSVRNQGGTSIGSFAYRVTEPLAGGASSLIAEGTAGPVEPGAGVIVEVPLTLPEGEHLLRVELDPDGLVAEAREDNNITETAVRVVDRDLPDLAVDDAELVVSPPNPAVGETVTVTATVRNPGGEAASAPVELWDGEPGEGVLITSEVVTVPIDGSQVVTASFTTTAATVSVTALADPADALAEISEGNNRARRFVVDRPDLAVGFDNFELTPWEPLDGESVTGTITVRNAGTLPASGVAVSLYDGDPATGAEIFSGLLDEVLPGGNGMLDVSWVATGGAHALTVVVDPLDAIEELSESNNRTARQVAVPRAAGADLEVSLMDASALDHSALALAATGSVTVTVANSGDADAGAFLVRLVEDRDGDGRPSPGDRELAVGSLAAGVTAGGSDTIGLTVDATFPFYRPLVFVEVDPTDLVPERREDDNWTPLFAACAAGPVAPSFDAVEEWYLPGLEVESTPVVVQLTDDDGDGRIDSRDVPDVVFHTEGAPGRAVTARSGLDGTEIWTVRSTTADPIEGRLAHLAAADLDGDGVAEVIAVRGGRRLVALDHRGRTLWVSDPVESAGGYGWAGAPAVGDLDGDGVPEIALGRSVLSNTGRLLAQGTGNVGRNHNYYGPFGVPYLIDAPVSTIADVDLDGRAELVAGDTLYRLVGGSLEVVWNRTVPDKLMVDGFTAVGNLDGDPEAEIVYVSSNQVMVLNHDGSVRQSSRFVQPIVPFGERSFWAGPPSLGDLDGDGATEIVIAASRELVAFRANLTTLWRVPTSEASEMTAAVLFDLDGDGADEVLYLDQTSFRILDGATGAVLDERPNTSKTGTESPAVADVDGDGRAEILVPSNRSFGGDASTQGLHVLGHPSWRGARPIWNQHTFRGDEVQSDGTVASRQPVAWIAGAGFRSNLSLPVPETRLPNLTIGLPRVDRATPDGVPVIVRVGNGGLAPVPPGVRVALFDGDPSTGAVSVAEGVLEEGLLPGRYADLTLVWQVAGAAGQPAWARVDIEDAHAECSEEDNTVAFTVEESVAADLAIPSGGVSIQGSPTLGQELAVTVLVVNSGAASADGFVVRLYDGKPAPGRDVGEVTVSSLAPGTSLAVEIPWDTLGSLGGRHVLHAVADADDLLLEPSEDDNVGLLEVELGSATLPDLSIEWFTVEPAAVDAGEPVRFAAQLLNRGAPMVEASEVAFEVNGGEVGRVSVPEALDTGESRQVELVWSTAGRQGLLAVAADADPSGVVTEESEGNNRVEAELAVGAAALTLEVSTDQTTYSPGESAAVAVLAQNSGAATVSALLRVGITDSAGARIAELGEQTVHLPTGASTFDFSWPTGAAIPGAYGALAELSVNGVAVAQNAVLFSVERQVDLAAVLFTDRDLYPSGSTAILTGRVTNRSTNTAVSGLTARLAVTAAGGSEVYSTMAPLPTLYPGGEQALEAAWPVGTSPPGAYTASLEVRDGLGLLVAFASAPLAVEDSSDTGAGLRGDVVVAPRLAGAGGPLLVDLGVENQGNVDLPALPLRIDLIEIATGAVQDSAAATHSLARGELAADSLAFDTRSLPTGDYLVTLVAVLAGVEVRLDRAPVTVGPAASVADASVLEGDTGSGTLSFMVSLSEAFADAVTVDYATSDGTATAGVDYQSTAGTLTLPPGALSATVDVPVLGDLDAEPDEVLVLTLSNPSGVLLGRSQALGTIRDEEGCASTDLLTNGSAEDGSFSDPVPGWEEIGATGWRVRLGAPAPLEGAAAFAAPAGAVDAELAQFVDLAPFATRIDGGSQSFLFEGFVGSASEPDPDIAGVTVEYLDGAGVVLDSFESDDVVSAGAWTAVSDLRAVPVGTRSARVRLLASRAAAGDSLEVYFDRLALRSLGVATLVVGDAEVLEGDTGDVTLGLPITLSCSLGTAVTVSYSASDVTATAGSDYAVASGTVELPAGATAATIEVPVHGDGLDEADETLQVSISTLDEPVVVRSTAVGTIRDDDGPVTLGIADQNVSEGDDGTTAAILVVDLSAVSGKTVRASWSTGAATSGDPASAGSDYQTASGIVTIPAGETSATVSVAIVGDRLNEPGEAFVLDLVAPQGAVLGQARGTITILDDDPVEIRIGDASAVEGDAGEALATFPVTLSVPSVSAVGVSYATSDLDALAGVDYVAASGTLQIPAGETSGEITASVTGDLDKEPVETFLVTLSAPSGGHPTATLADPEAIGSIVDDDGILVSVADVTAREGVDPDAVFSVTLNKPAELDVSVDYQTVAGTATEGADFVPQSGTVTLVAGATTAQVPVSVADDSIVETQETFAFELSNPSGEAILLDAEATATLLDDDGWALNGSADDFGVPGCIVLTPDLTAQRGSAWWRQPIDLTESFDKTFRVYLGDKDSNGGSGIYFVLQDVGLTALGSSAGLGYGGLSPSLGVEVDTDGNSAGLPADHVSIGLNGNEQNLVAPVQASAVDVNIEDGLEHELRVIWNAPNRTLDVHFDDSERIVHVRDLVASPFSGDPSVYWGLTGGTNSSSSRNLQYFCDPVQCYEGGPPPAISVADAFVTEGDAGTVQLHFPVTASCSSAVPMSVSFATSDGTAVAGSDYQASQGTLTFAPGETSLDLVIEVVGDDLAEGDEELFVTLSSPAGADLRHDRATGRIATDDFGLRPLAERVVEGDATASHGLAVELTAPAHSTIQVPWHTEPGTAEEGVDYQAASGSFTFSTGSTQAVFELTVLGDLLEEGDEEFFVVLDPPAGSQVSASSLRFVLADDDPCVGANLVENGGANLPTVDGEIPGWVEVIGSDWRPRFGDPAPPEGVSYFFSGVSSLAELAQVVDLSGFGLAIDRGEQAFVARALVRSFNQAPADTSQVIFEWLDASGAMVESWDSGSQDDRGNWRTVGTVTTPPAGTRAIRVRLIADRNRGSNNDGYFDDVVVAPLGQPTLQADSPTVLEGSAGTSPVVFTVRASCAFESTASVNYLTADGTAKAGADYQATSGVLTFVPGEIEKTVEVQVLGDTSSEGDEVFYLDLANAAGAGIGPVRAEATIRDDESALSIADVTVTEGGSADFMVTLDPATDQTVRVDYATADGTAVAGTDFETASGTLTFAPGETAKTVSVATLADGETESDETFSVLLSGSVNAIVADDEGQATLLEGDDLRVSIADARVVEGDAGTVTAVFAITLSPVTSQRVEVAWSTQDGTAVAGEDYVASSGLVVFDPGVTAREVSVEVIGDTEAEGSEVFLLVLDPPDVGQLEDGEANGVIADDDDCPGPTLLENGDADLPAIVGTPRFWEEVSGTWTIQGASPSPQGGASYIAVASGADSELRQDVDVSVYSAFVDAGIQLFALEGFVRSASETSPDTSRILVEYRDDSGAVLDLFDSGEIASVGQWRQVADLRLAPVGTRTIRVRLVGRRTASSGSTNVYFDSISLLSVGTPVLQVGTGSVAEGDSGTVSLTIPVTLSCPADAAISVDFATGGGSALAGTDYQPASGSLTFAPGETAAAAAVTVSGDSVLELEETIGLILSNADGAVPVESRRGGGTILDDDNEGRTTREIRTFWLGEMRIFAWAPNTQITLIDIETGQPLSMSHGRISQTNVTSNPFILADAGDSFEGIGSGLRIRIVASDADGDDQLTPITVWTGSLSSTARHPASPPVTGNSWASYLPAFSLRERANGREIGNQFLGFTSRELTLFVRKGVDPTLIQIEDLVTNTDSDDDDSVVLGPADAEYADAEIEIYHLDGFEDDTVRIAANTELSVLAGLGTRDAPDWTISPPSYAQGDDGIELGTEFYTFVHDVMTIFPLEDDTTVEIIDLSDGDDSTVVTFAEGDTDGDYELFTPVTSTRVGAGLLPRSSDPLVTLHTTGNPFDDDYVKVVSDKPVLVYVGPAGSDTNEFADVAFSVPTGPESRIIYCFAQNGDENDLQIFGFTDDTEVTITSLSRTQNFGSATFHDFQIGPGIGNSGGSGPWMRGTPGSDVWWSSGVWSGELLRIESNKPIVVIGGDYDSPSFGAFIPFLVDSLDLPPVADAGADRSVTAGEVVTFDGTSSFDQDELPGSLVPRWEWDLDLATDSDSDGVPGNDVDATGPTPQHVYLFAGVYPVRLTFFDDEGEADDDVVQVTVDAHPLAVTKTADSALVRPGDPLTYTVTVENTGTGPVTGVVVTDELPEDTTLAGAVTTSSGTVVSSDPVRVEIASLAPAETVTISIPVQVVSPLAPEVTEIANQAAASADELPAYPSDDPGTPEPVDPTVTAVDPVPLAPQLAASKSDSLANDADGDGNPSPGDEIAYEIVISNVGTAPASTVVFQDLIPEHTTIVAGSLTTTGGSIVSEVPVEVDLGTMAAGASATIAFRVRVDLPLPGGVDRITNQGTVTSAELPTVPTDDPDIGGSADPTVTLLAAAPELVAEKTAALSMDSDGDGVVSPGDELEYTVVVRNVGNTSATTVVLDDPIPEHTTSVAGSVIAPEGSTIESEDPVRVVLGEVAGGASAEVRFRVLLDAPLAAGVVEVTNQGLVTSAELPDVVTDDPGVQGAADPTVTPVTAAPELRVEKTASLFEDLDADGAADPGDALLYRIVVANDGNTVATEVVLTDPIPANTAVEAGTVQTSLGTVLSEDPVTVTLGTIPAGAEATVTFRVRIDDPFPTDVSAVVNQAEITSAELDPVPSDDPATAAEGDATATDIVVTPEVSIDDATVSEAGGPDAVFTVSLSRSSPGPVEVPYATGDGPGSPSLPAATAGLDYAAASGTLVFAPSETAKTVSVDILDDAVDELDERFTLTLGTPVGAVLARAEGAGTILDDDTAAFSVSDTTADEGDEGTTPMAFAIDLDLPSDRETRVDWTTVAGSAEDGLDFTGASGTAVVAAGSTHSTATVDVLGDALFELNESFTLEISNPVAATIDAAVATGTIVDDELCLGSNVILNPGAEEGFVGGPIPSWTEVAGTSWVSWHGFFPPDPVEGATSFYANKGDAQGYAELVQDVDLAPWAASIAGGEQAFRFEGYVQTLAENPSDTARIVVEYLDASGTVALDVWDSGDVVSPANWTGVSDERTVPPGTAFARVLLIGGLATGDTLDAFFDALSLRPLRSPELVVGDVRVAETAGSAVFSVRPSCGLGYELNFDWATADGTALAGQDYVAASGTSTILAGEGRALVPIPIVADAVEEDDETFVLDATSATPEPIRIVDPRGIGLIFEEGPCAGEGLGVAPEYGVFLLGTADLDESSTGGRLAAASWAQLHTYSVGSGLSGDAGDVLVVGTDLTYQNGTVFNGDVVHGGTASLTSVTVLDGTVRPGTPIDFAVAGAAYHARSQEIAALPVNGTVDQDPFNLGQWDMTGTDPELNVFTIAGSDLSHDPIRITVPEGSTVVVNVTGVSYQNFFNGMTLNGVTAESVVFNFPEAETIGIEGIIFEGSILAPGASVMSSNVDHYGYLVAGAIQGYRHSNNSTFSGCLPPPGGGQ